MSTVIVKLAHFAGKTDDDKLANAQQWAAALRADQEVILLLDARSYTFNRAPALAPHILLAREAPPAAPSAPARVRWAALLRTWWAIEVWGRLQPQQAQQQEPQQQKPQPPATTPPVRGQR